MPSNDEYSIAKTSRIPNLRYGLTGILAAVGIILSYGSFQFTKTWEEDKAQEQLQRQVIDYSVSVEKELSRHLEFLNSIVSLFNTFPIINRDDFQRFTSKMLEGTSGVQALEWIPRVPVGERPKFEMAARADGFPDFVFKEKNTQQKMVAANARDEYFPVYYVEPLKGNERALGFDLASNATRRAALVKARDTGKLVISDRIKLVQETGDQFAFLAFQPIYQGDIPLRSAESRREFLSGFALGVFRIGDVIEAAWARNTRPGGLDIFVLDTKAPTGKRVLYFHPSRVRKAPPSPVPEEAILAGAHASSAVSVGDRNWTLVFKPVRGYFENRITWVPWSTLFVGLFLTGLLTVYLMSLVGREKQITDLVRQRTGDLKESEERFRNLIEGSAQGVLIHDFYKPRFVNQAYADILGYQSPDDIIAQDTAFDHVAPEDRERLKSYAVARRAGKDVPELYEFQAIRRDGSTVWLENRVRPIIWEGQPAHQRTVVDITERKQAETMKNEFISTVSHELRTPLTSIKGSLGLIKSGVVKGQPEKLDSMLEIAYANSDRLERLINDILDIEKIDAGKMDFHLQPVEITELVEDAIEANKGYGDEYGVEFVLKDTLGRTIINGDHDRLMQALSNLMSNAAKFSPTGGRVYFSVTKDATGVRVSVTDQGPGIPKEFRDKIFEKFTQADASDTRNRDGTGLGLSITKAIIEHHGGTLGFVTETGEGTTFYFTLPEFVERGAHSLSVDGRANEYRALIVEDDPDIATVLDFALRQDGFNTVIATSAAETKKLLANDIFDIMTLDLGLPDQDGISLLKELRENERTKNLPVVVVSATAREGSKHINGQAFGIIDWLQKPIDYDRLRERMYFAIRNNSPRLHILHVEDDPDIVRVVSAIVGETADFTAVSTLSGAKRYLEKEKFDLVILDLLLPDGNGEDVLPFLNQQGDHSTPVIVFSSIEASKEKTRDIEAVLLKSKTSNEELLETIRSACLT